MNAYCISLAMLQSQEQKLLHVEFHTIYFKGISIQSTFNYAIISIPYNYVVSTVYVRSSKVKTYKHITLCISNGKILQIKGYTPSLPHAK